MALTRKQREASAKALARTLEKTGYNKLVGRHGKKWRPPFPDLKVEQRTPPCGNGFGPVPGRQQLPADAKQFPVGNFHKQGSQLVSTADLEWAGGKKPS